MQGVLQELEMLLFQVVGGVGLLHHADQRLADADRMDRPVALRERHVDGLHDEARADAEEALAPRILAQLVRGELLGPALLEHLLAIVDPELGHQVALGRGLEPGEDGEHRGDLERVRRHLDVELRALEKLLVDLHLLGEAEIVGHLDDDDAVEDGLVGVVGLELLPLGLVAVGDDDRVDVDRAVAARRRHELLLRRGDHGVEILGLVLEDLDELDHAAVADVEGAVELEHARVALAVAVELGDVLRADQHRGVLVVRVDRRHHADAAPGPLAERHRLDGHGLVAVVELGQEAVAADRAEVALDPHAQHVLEGLPEMAGDQVQGLLVDGAALDHVDGVGVLETALQALDERALARAHGTHEVENLASLLATHRRGVEVAHDLVERALHAEELVLEEAVDLDRLVAENPLGARVRLDVDLADARRHHHVVHTLVGKSRELRTLLHELQILEEGSLPLGFLPLDPVLLDQGSEVDLVNLHARSSRST